MFLSSTIHSPISFKMKLIFRSGFVATVLYCVSLNLHVSVYEEVLLIWVDIVLEKI